MSKTSENTLSRYAGVLLVQVLSVPSPRAFFGRGDRMPAAVAKREMEYWLSEAAEWKTLRESSDPFKDSIAVQLDWCADLNSH